jgi:competence protein ComGF
MGIIQGFSICLVSWGLQSIRAVASVSNISSFKLLAAMIAFMEKMRFLHLLFTGLSLS